MADLVSISISVSVDTTEKFFVLKIQKNSGFFNFTGFENTLDDFFPCERLTGFFEDVGNDLCDRTTLLAPDIESVNTTTD